MIENKIINVIKTMLSGIMRRFKLSQENLHTIVKVVCAVSLGTALLSLIVTYATISGWSELHSSIRQDLSRINLEYRNSLVVNRYEIMSIHTKSLRDIIAEEIESTYAGKHDELRRDIETYIEKNDTSNKLFHIFNDSSYAYIRKWFSTYPNVRVIIASREDFMFTSTMVEPMRMGSVPTVVFEQPPKTVLVLNKDANVTAQGFDYIVNNLELDKSMEVLAVSYIYEHDDILGVRDVLPNGTSSKNSKLAVGIAFNA